MASFVKKWIARTKKQKMLACTMPLNSDGTPHVHGEACFVDIMPLTVVELFQSQGCKSCPPAIPLIHAAIANPSVLLLTYDVTYWDHSGWKDTFGSTQWDQRQRAYVMKWGRNGIFTPQVVASGVSDGIGARQGEVQEIIVKANEARSQMQFDVAIDLNLNALKVSSEASEAPTHDVVVIVYDPEPQVVKVGKGPNKGKKMEHRNLVRNVIKVGEWKGGVVEIELPELPRSRFEKVAIVQQGPGGPIVSALKF